MNKAVILAGVLGLAACSPSVPDSGAGVGFQDYDSYMREQEAAAARQTAAPLATAPTAFSPEIASAAIDRASGTGLPVTTPVAPVAAAPMATTPMATTPLAATTANVAVSSDESSANRARGDAPSTIMVEQGEMVHNSTGISDEQDFAAVSARETIESDKERLARNRQQYTVIQPTAVPERTETGPNIVEYALATTNTPGQQLYSRSALRLTNPMVACAKYGSPDRAQQVFLENGGPERDRKGLDPDGDGFACDWDPRPFRQ